jgi:hypothetical protein
LASKAARRGLRAEDRIIDAINDMDELGKKLIENIEGLTGFKCLSWSAQKGPTRAKADVIVTCNGKRILISIKEFDVKADYNHVERNYVDFYAGKWSMSQDVYTALKRFVGEVDGKGNPISIETLEREAELLNTSPGKLSKKRRTLLNQLSPQTREIIKDFFRSNKTRILKEIFIDDENVEFFVIVKRQGNVAYYYLVPTKDVLDIYSSGDVVITPRGSLQIGNVVLQRKSGNHRTDGGWADAAASQLQFKIRPSECIKNRVPLMSEKVR